MRTLRAGHLVLEPQVAAHAAEMFAVLGDPAVYEFEGEAPPSHAALERRFALLESRLSPSGDERWLNWVIRVPPGELAGFVQASITADGTAHIAYVLGSRFWRRGIGTAAVGAMLDELAAAHAVRHAVATLKASNYRSLALLQRLGFTPESAAAERRVPHERDETVLHKRLRSDTAVPVAAERSG